MQTDMEESVVMSEHELAELGGGVIAYIKPVSSKQAREMFPQLEGIPKKGTLFSLHAANGTPLALTDTRAAAVGHALGDDLEIATLQ